MEKKNIEIPFGAFDSELVGFEYPIPVGYEAEIKDGKVIVRKMESEDEKIRKEIRDFICWATDRGSITKEQMEKTNLWLSWLEKQGEQKRTDKVEPKFKEGDNIRLKDGDGRLWKIEKIREDGYTIIGHGLDETDFLFLDDKWEVVEPYQESNPTAPAPVRDNYDEIKQAETSPTLSNSSNIRKNAWSEEDEENLNWFEKFFRAESVVAGGKDIPQDRYLWFKNLKNRVQPKQEWSEEDDRMYNRIVSFIPQHLTAESYTACITWLKSLRPQNRWKPSEEQITCLHDAIARYNREGFSAATLTSLLGQLKKLKG